MEDSYTWPYEPKTRDAHQKLDAALLLAVDIFDAAHAVKAALAAGDHMAVEQATKTLSTALGRGHLSAIDLDLSLPPGQRGYLC